MVDLEALDEVVEEMPTVNALAAFLKYLDVRRQANPTRTSLLLTYASTPRRIPSTITRAVPPPGPRFGAHATRKGFCFFSSFSLRHREKKHETRVNQETSARSSLWGTNRCPRV